MANELLSTILHELMHHIRYPQRPRHNLGQAEDPDFYAEERRRTDIARERYNELRAQCP